MSDPVFRLTMLPAGPGDALWLEYGHGSDIRSVLIDGGIPETMPSLTAKVESLPPPHRIELVVVTHTDVDHLGALVELLACSDTVVDVRDIWFNGWKHLPGANEGDRLGAEEAEFFSLIIGVRDIPWNQAFGGGPVMIEETGPLLSHQLEGGLKLTILSPGAKELTKLKADWQVWLDKHGLGGTDWSPEKFLEYMHNKRRGRNDILGGTVPNIDDEAATSFSGDSSPTNGSGIAMLAEFEGHSCLLAADAFAPRVRSSVERLRKERKTTGGLVIGAVKSAHHGSKRNNSNPLLKSLDCSRYLISTDGSTHGHPDTQAIARMIKGSPPPVELYFNYRSSQTEVWETHPDRATFGFTPNYPEGENGTRTVNLLE